MTLKLKTEINDELILKISDGLLALHQEELGFRKILFKFIKKNPETMKKVDSSAYRKYDRGYMKDLTSDRLSHLAKGIIAWKKAEKETCSGCIIIANCSTVCKKLDDRYHGLHIKDSKEFWNGQKGKV